jgi:endonuclease I
MKASIRPHGFWATGCPDSAIGRLMNSQDLKDALIELARASSKDYYKEGQDEADRTQYYKNVSGSVSPEERYRQLSELLTKTHAPRLLYKPGKYLYPWVDLHPDYQLRHVYSGKTFDPEAAILADFRTDLERAGRLREVLSAKAKTGGITIANELARIEDELPYNCEHVVPRSWFDQSMQPMLGDLHHLFTCEEDCNSFRGNIPYYDFADYRDVVRNDCGKREEKKFEPNASKGAVARATLYFLLRYPGQIDNVSDEYEQERLEILLSWHNNNEVSLYEKHRNMVIFKEQGNRNPLIDFPQWGVQINFSLGLGQAEQ